MENEKEMLLELGDVFTNPGIVTPYIELKFRMAGKYGPENLETMLEKLVEKEILTRFEFNNNVNYKSKEDIPLSLGEAKSAPAPAGGSSDLKALEEIVFAIADAVGNEKVNDLVSKYKSK